MQTPTPTIVEEIAAQYQGSRPRRALDTQNGSSPCWVAHEWLDSALVVYDDEPDAVVAADNQHGRFSDIL